jgi:uridylate kinase
MRYNRILLKLSGESLMGKQQYGIDPSMLSDYADEIKAIVAQGVQVAIVFGGGNIFRGLQGIKSGFDRIQGDYMGMLATIINSMAIQGALDQLGIRSKILSGIAVDPIAEKMSGRRAIELMENGYVVIIAGGTGNPYFTTDSAAVLRALEIKADAILKGTRVDGVYTADPEKDPAATKYQDLTFEEAYEKNLKIMDLTAFTLCRENHLPVIVFNMNEKGNLQRLMSGEGIGTLIKN